MTIPNYLATFRRAVQEIEQREKSKISEKSPTTLISLNSFISYPRPSEPAGKSPTENSPKSVSAEGGAYEKNELNEKRVGPFSFAAVLDRLERRCPDHIKPARWRQCVEDASRFLASWGDKAEAFCWTADELIGLHEPPAKPHPSYSRLSRYDCTGLIWLLQGRHVVALTAATAAILGDTGNTVTYRKLRKPALGPLGDSLDDFIA